MQTQYGVVKSANVAGRWTLSPPLQYSGAICATSPSNPPSAAAIRGIPPSPAAAPAAGGWGIPGSRHVYSVGFEGVPAGGAVEAVVRSAVVLVAALLPFAAGALRSSAAARSSFWRSRIFGFLGWSRPLHRDDGAMASSWCVGVSVPRLRRRRAGASSSGGVELGWWCVGGGSGVCEGSLLASPSWVAVGWWCCWREGVLAELVHRSRFRHRVADGSCGFFHAWQCSRVKVRWWFGYFVSGDGSGVDRLASYASCVCCTEVFPAKKLNRAWLWSRGHGVGRP